MFSVKTSFNVNKTSDFYANKNQLINGTIKKTNLKIAVGISLWHRSDVKDAFQMILILDVNGWLGY